MRLWHIDLIDYLPKQWLQGQHRECCAMRGKGWGKKHSTVDYVFNHSYIMLWKYHVKVMTVLIEKYKVKIDINWMEYSYRGKILGHVFTLPNVEKPQYDQYPEHNEQYLNECLENLAEKGIIITAWYGEEI